MPPHPDKPLLGQLGEALAVEYLKLRGYMVIERNYRAPSGEIDIVADDHGVLVFVEVRTKTSEEFGRPLETIGALKRMHVSRAACEYLAERGVSRASVRFDAIGVLLREGEDPEIELVQNAFSRGGRL
jgi:putative endonuclease